jgi:hypothetical protein
MLGGIYIRIKYHMLAHHTLKNILRDENLQFLVLSLHRELNSSLLYEFHNKAFHKEVSAVQVNILAYSRNTSRYGITRPERSTY